MLYQHCKVFKKDMLPIEIITHLMDTAVVIVADKINTAKDDVSKISQS